MSSQLVREFADGELVPGTRYRVVGLIGTGGMGSVYDVEHTELGKRFVLKALLRELSRRKDLVARLRQEWRALARLEHPCIVSVTDAGTSDNGVPFYVMERLDGETLSDRLRRERKLPAAQALLVAAGVLDGLSAAHEIGIVHRDVKPPNIFMVAAGGVKLLDFGIAKIASSSAEVITARGVAIGTPRYMSPEQARGDRVDGRADLYATGLILFEMISGRGPFDDVADANQLLLAHLSKAPPRLASLSPAVPPGLDRIVASLLEKDPRARPPSARRVAEALRQIAAELGAVAERAGASYPPPARGSTPPAGPSAAGVDPTRPASPRASPQFDATMRMKGPAPDATVPSAPPGPAPDATVPSAPPGGDTTVLDPKRTVRLEDMEARRSEPPRAPAAAAGVDAGLAAADGATSPSLPDWHPGAGQAPASAAPASAQAAAADRTMTFEELGVRPRPVEQPPPTHTAVPAAVIGGGTPPPVESGPPPALAGAPRTGTGVAVALGLAALLAVGLLGVGAWFVLGSGHHATHAGPAAASPAASASAGAALAAAPASVAASAAPPASVAASVAPPAPAAPGSSPAVHAATPPASAKPTPAPSAAAPVPASAPAAAKPSRPAPAPTAHTPAVHHATRRPAGMPASGL